jgi:hypothetical protein
MSAMRLALGAGFLREVMRRRIAQAVIHLQAMIGHRYQFGGLAMKLRQLFGCLLLTLAVVPATAQDASSVIASASKAMGLKGVNSLYNLLVEFWIWRLRCGCNRYRLHEYTVKEGAGSSAKKNCLSWFSAAIAALRWW